MIFPRASGILLHPTSLPSRGGIGDFGPAAYEFADFLAAARQTLWQVLPLAPVGTGYSPYSATSAFAGNPLLISLERLAERGWIAPERLAELPDRTGNVDYPSVIATKSRLLAEAAANFLRGDRDRSRYQQFVEGNAAWLEDFVLFDVLRRKFNEQSWNLWPRELARREPAALDRVCREMCQELDVARVIQFAFHEQWRALHQHCCLKGIRIIGDVAIFVSYDSADVWTNPRIFRLNGELNPEVVAGVPPDAFSTTGQRWGNPLYDWEVLRERGYDWWIGRMRWALNACDYLRLDHFRGFEAYWEIPASEPTAVNGRWVAGPRDDFFTALRNALAHLPLIAEDLGMITPEVHALRERLRMPGMRVLQFGFGDPGAHIYLPHKYDANTVVYTGTHDNDTTLGWWNHIPDWERAIVQNYFGPMPDGIHWAMIRAALSSVAALAVIPLQDVLGLGSEARMNVPSRADGNWAWRYRRGALTPELARTLAGLAEVTDRYRSDAGQSGHGEVREEFAA